MERYTLNDEPVDLDDFLSRNKFDDETVRRILALEEGQWIHFGGGAQPDFILRRLEER